MSLPIVDPVAGVRLSAFGFSRQDAENAVLQNLAARKQAPVAPAAASITWGKASDFSLAAAASVTVIFPPDNPPDNPQTQEPPPFQYTEEWRSEEKIRVENPDDADQYVMVARVKSIIFRGQDNKRIQLNFRPPR